MNEYVFHCFLILINLLLFKTVKKNKNKVEFLIKFITWLFLFFVSMLFIIWLLSFFPKVISGISSYSLEIYYYFLAELFIVGILLIIVAFLPQKGE